MTYCNNCGVVLENNMQVCPLCGQAVSDSHAPLSGNTHGRPGTPAAASPPGEKLTSGQKKFVWGIISMILLSSVAAALLINLIINKTISWAEYPVAVCLIIFSYVSAFVFWSQQAIIQISGGFITAAALLLLLDAFTGGLQWSWPVAIPILFLASVVTGVLLIIIRHTASRGVNLIAYTFIGSALLCTGIEAILSLYRYQQIELKWSIIVCLCVSLVSTVLLFMHYRLRKGRSLEKTFHL